jgi:hypothetical protein
MQITYYIVFTTNYRKTWPEFTLVTVHEAVTAIYTSGGWQRFTGETQATECTLTLPDTRICIYRPGTTTTPHNECTFPNDYLSYNYCQFLVYITSKQLSGVYNLTYTDENGVVREDIYNIYLRGGKKELFLHISIIFRSCYEIRFLIINENCGEKWH